MIKIRIFEVKRLFWISWEGFNGITKILIRGMQEIRVRRRIWNNRSRGRKGDAMWGREPRTEDSLQKLEKAERQILPGSKERAQSYRQTPRFQHSETHCWIMASRTVREFGNRLDVLSTQVCFGGTHMTPCSLLNPLSEISSMTTIGWHMRQRTSLKVSSLIVRGH